MTSEEITRVSRDCAQDIYEIIGVMVEEMQEIQAKHDALCMRVNTIACAAVGVLFVSTFMLLSHELFSSFHLVGN